MFCGRMAELVDASVLGTDRAICVGSSPISPTIRFEKIMNEPAILARDLQTHKGMIEAGSKVTIVGTSIVGPPCCPRQHYVVEDQLGKRYTLDSSFLQNK